MRFLQKQNAPRNSRGRLRVRVRSGSLAFFILVASGPAKSVQVRRSVPRSRARNPAADVAAVVDVVVAEHAAQHRLLVENDEGEDEGEGGAELAEEDVRAVRKDDGEAEHGDAHAEVHRVAD